MNQKTVFLDDIPLIDLVSLGKELTPEAFLIVAKAIPSIQFDASLMHLNEDGIEQFFDDHPLIADMIFGVITEEDIAEDAA